MKNNHLLRWDDISEYRNVLYAFSTLWIISCHESFYATIYTYSNNLDQVLTFIVRL